jgi:N-acetyl-gamma-glutamyl-phosphate reductase
VIFGVSGFSGAGRTPSDKNNPDRLRDNLIPYSLTGHVHEKEISHQLDRHVRFMPHVAPFFRGISLTISGRVDHEATADKLLNVYLNKFRDEPRIRISAEVPEVQAVRGTPDVHIGGFAVDDRDPTMFTVVVALDNLSKGAATQAVQNLNLALGLDEQMGISNE